MTQPPSKPSRLSVRLTPEERAALEARAQGRKLSDVVRDELFGGVVTTRGNQGRRRDLAQVLALLGRAEFGRSLAELARLARDGALEMSPEIEAEVAATRADLAWIKTQVMAALRVRER